ncbi:GNAT family N-acetyltransferase [Sutcliffiella halmapala]|uniref:GNAT family N-acetyltransferase n=1 Tax=Sutcliffiella halmapala TaxID=79882 RepID=UPI000994D0B1|nr:GNAT family protein [Sutcliffiella halmapala]
MVAEAIFCESSNLYLRDVQISDSTLIAKWKNEKLMRQMSVGLDTVINEQNHIKKSIDAKHPYFIISIKDNNKPIGYIRLNWMDNTNYFGWLRFGLGEERGKGYSKEALHSFLQKTFENGTKRIDAEVYEFNEISFKLLTALGFTHEGTRRKAYYSNEEFYDVHTLGLLHSDNNK